MVFFFLFEEQYLPPSNLMGSVSQSVTVSDFEIYLMEKTSAELTKSFLSQNFGHFEFLELFFMFSNCLLIFVLAVMFSRPIGCNNHG